MSGGLRLTKISMSMILSCLPRSKQAPPVAPLQPRIWPSQPWKRIHVDFAGPFMGDSYLIAVDAHSKWPEVHYNVLYHSF